MSGSRRQLVNFAEQTRIYNHLKAVTEMVQSENSGIYYLQYKKDWNDVKVGEKFGYSKYQIKEFRQANVGKESPTNAGKMFSRVALMKRLDALEARFNALEDLLAKTYGSERTGSQRLNDGQGNDLLSSS